MSKTEDAKNGKKNDNFFNDDVDSDGADEVIGIDTRNTGNSYKEVDNSKVR